MDRTLPGPPSPERAPIAVPDRMIDQAPPWLVPVIRQTIWRIVWVALAVALLLLSLAKARGLTRFRE